MVKQDFLLEGKTLNGAAEMPFGVANLVVRDEARLLWSWLAMVVDAAVAIWSFS